MPKPLTVLGIASLGVFMAFVDATIVNIAFPDIERSFSSSSIASLSWVLNAYNIVFASFLVAAGRISDLLGRRRIFICGLAVFTSASALCAVAPSASGLIGFRCVQALGAALMVPSSLALVLDAFAQERRAHAVALFSAVGALAAGVGPSLGGLLVTAANWRLVFLVNVPIGIAAFVLSRRELVESRAPGRRRMPDLRGALVFAGAIAALVLGVVEGQSWGWASARIIGTFAIAIALGALCVWRCTWHQSPVIDLKLLRIRTFSTANAMTVLAAAGFYGYTLCNVLFLTGVWRYSVLQAGLGITPGPFVAAAVAGPTSRLAQRYGHRPVLVTGGVIWGAAVLWFVARTGTRPDYLGVWLPGMILLGIGAGSFFPNLGAAAVASAPGESFATATSLNSVTRQVGAALGVAIVIAIIGRPSPLDALAAFHHAWSFGATVLIVAGLGCLAVGRIGTGDNVMLTPSLGASAQAVLQPPSEPIASGGVRRRRPVSATVPGNGGPPESVAAFLAGVPIFAGLADPLREQLSETAVSVRLQAGEWLFHEGDPDDAMYIVRTGRLEIVTETEPPLVLRVLGRGDVFGELALLSRAPRSASARAARPCDLISIRGDEFDHLLRERPEVSLGLVKTMAEQLRKSQSTVTPTRPLPVTVALVALDDRVPIATLGATLAAAIGRYARVAVLNGTEASPPAASADSATAVYAPLLDRCAAGHDHVALVAGRLSDADPWATFCVQQADRILAIGSGAGPPDRAGTLLALKGCDLVAWNVPPGSGSLAAWATALDPIETHAWRPGPELGRDLLRTARRLTGRSTGLVLSGGGARAFSHIGVLEELLAAGVTIDRVAGVSMGAYIGALFAMGHSPQEIDARCYEEWIRRRPLGDYSLPRHALIRGQRAVSLVERSVGSVAIEELGRSFFCHSADLRSAETVVSRFGPLNEALQRTMCLPIIAPPRVRGERLLVDGALVDNLPIERMAALGEGPIIAVDVKATLARSDATEIHNGARPERLPSLGETVMRVVFMASSNTSEAARRHASLLISPRTPGIGLLEFHQIDHAREAGREAAREALQNIPATLVQ